MGRKPEMKHRITSLCQSCDRDFLCSGPGCMGGERPESRKLETSLRPKTQCMQITSCLKPPDATVPEIQCHVKKKLSLTRIYCYYIQSGLKWSEKLKLTINFNFLQKLYYKYCSLMLTAQNSSRKCEN